MCWCSKIKINKIIADKDTVVYKYGAIKGKDKLHSQFYPFEYIKDVLNKAITIEVSETIPINSEQQEPNYNNNYSALIEEGYHSFSGKLETKHKEDGMFYLYFVPSNNSIYAACTPINLSFGKFIIPKGTAYYINEYKELVSENLIYTGQNVPSYLMWDYYYCNKTKTFTLEELFNLLYREDYEDTVEIFQLGHTTMKDNLLYKTPQIRYRGYIDNNTLENIWNLLNWGCWAETKPEEVHSTMSYCNDDIILRKDKIYYVCESDGWKTKKSLEDAFNYRAKGIKDFFVFPEIQVKGGEYTTLNGIPYLVEGEKLTEVTW